MYTLRNHFWSIFLSLFFAALIVLGIWYLAITGGFNRSISVSDFFLMSLAVWRLTRLFTYDAITKFIRDWFEGAKPSSLRGSLHVLLNCPWCTGLWFGYFVVFFYFASVFAFPVILILAVAAVGSFFQILSNLIGWNAEYKKAQTAQLQSGGTSGTGGTC